MTRRHNVSPRTVRTWQRCMVEREGLIKMTRTYSSWVGGVLRLVALYTQRLGDMPPEDVVREGGQIGQTPMQFMQANQQFFPLRRANSNGRRKEFEIDVDAEVYVLEFELVDKFKFVEVTYTHTHIHTHTHI